MNHAGRRTKGGRVAGIAAALAASFVIQGCSASAPEATRDREPASNAIDVANIAYTPEVLEIAVGEKVVWTNKDESVHHTVTSGTPGEDGVPGVSKGEPAKPDGAFDGDLPDASSTFTFRFDDAGTFDYFCAVHPSMTGTIVVR